VVAPAISPTVVEDEQDIEEDQEGSARGPLATVEETLPLLQSLPELSGVSIEALHGRMPSVEKDEVMTRFAAGDCDVVVATTVSRGGD